MIKIFKNGKFFRDFVLVLAVLHGKFFRDFVLVLAVLQLFLPSTCRFLIKKLVTVLVHAPAKKFFRMETESSSGILS